MTFGFCRSNAEKVFLPLGEQTAVHSISFAFQSIVTFANTSKQRVAQLFLLDQYF